MPTLDWIGKKAVVNHHQDVPYRLIHCNGALSAGDPDAGNLLVEGDNLVALKALLPYYAGKAKCIYIDPPYNTGNENWAYNDNVNSPEIVKWLGETVGKEAEDLTRHDKWLCMMYPRLRLLYEFLAEDGVLLCSINDFEVHSLRDILSSIFQANNFVATFIWINEGNIDNQSKIKTNHEYVVAFSRREKHFSPGAVVDPTIEESSKLLNERIANTIVKNGPKNPISEITLPLGFPTNFEEGIIEPNSNPKFWPKFDTPITVRNRKIQHEVRVSSGWSSKNFLEMFIAAQFHDIIDRKGQRTRFYLTETGAVYVEKDRSEEQSHVLTVLAGMGTVQEAAAQLNTMGVSFSYPKPVRLISYLLTANCRDKDAIFIDSFAGSGTTGHAVLEMNAKDSGNRRFVLVEMDSDISKRVTAPRLTAAVSGIGHTGGLSGGFRYCTLGEPLFDADGGINPSVTFTDLAAHVFFAETGQPIPKKAQDGNPFLGTFQSRAVYLLWSREGASKSGAHKTNILSGDALAALPSPGDSFSGERVVYADGCTVSRERLTRDSILFKQVPYRVAGN